MITKQNLIDRLKINKSMHCILCDQFINFIDNDYKYCVFCNVRIDLILFSEYYIVYFLNSKIFKEFCIKLDNRFNFISSSIIGNKCIEYKNIDNISDFSAVAINNKFKNLELFY